MAIRSDVCLILEGTYPYITGGVSSWVHQLVKALHEIRFSLLVILPTEDYGKEMKYELPPNIVEIHQVLIHTYQLPTFKTKGNKDEGYRIIREFLNQVPKGNFLEFPNLVTVLAGNPPVISPSDIIFSKESWNIIHDFYIENNLDISFIDYFWTFRFSMLPLLLAINGNIPQAKIYHAVATGYAGIIGAVARVKNTDSALILTEHGIYAKERKIEIADARWIYDEYEESYRPDHSQSFFKLWWTKFFHFLSQITYQFSDEIITLYEGNRQSQIGDGADPDKCRVIPNGLDINKYVTDNERLPPSAKEKIIVSLVGRVVPIKDVKTFINACKIICDQNPKIECWICGPTDEDQQYYDDCVILRNLLDLEDRLIFKGRLNLLDYYPQMDVLVLTSVSEAQPLVILEANCYGMPVVVTDVGSCTELINGRTPEDKELGPCGYVTGVANPEATASAVLKITSDDNLYLSMGEAGRRRVVKYYQEVDLFAQYLNCYEGYL